MSYLAIDLMPLDDGYVLRWREEYGNSRLANPRKEALVEDYIKPEERIRDIVVEWCKRRRAEIA